MPSAKSFRCCNRVGAGENTWILGNSDFSPLRSVVVAVIDICSLIYGELAVCESISFVKLLWKRSGNIRNEVCVQERAVPACS